MYKKLFVLCFYWTVTFKNDFFNSPAHNISYGRLPIFNFLDLNATVLLKKKNQITEIYYLNKECK